MINIAIKKLNLKLLACLLVCCYLAESNQADPRLDLGKQTVVTVVGAQWGDEGKGKFADLLAEQGDITARFNGGNNAGHTVKVGDTYYFLHALPSGVVRPNTVNYIGNGCVLDLIGIFSEIKSQEAKGVKISPKNLKIAANVPLVLSLHKEMDALQEQARGKHTIGTTKKGIGPAYSDKVGRRALRAGDCLNLSDPKNIAMISTKVDTLLAHHNALRKGMGAPLLSKKLVMEEVLTYGKQLAPFVTEAWRELYAAKKAGKKILIEAGQGVLLDIDFGSYPNVTSSNTIGLAASTGLGVSFPNNYIIGVAKAYTTRVGSGPFPTMLNDRIGEKLEKVGREFGVTTGRRRSTGWLDIVALKQASILSGFHALILTKADILDDFDEVKVCIGYKIKGKTYDYLPSNASTMSPITPIYRTFKGWKDTSGVTKESELDKNLLAYIAFIEKKLGIPVIIISTGPERTSNVIRYSPF